MKPELWRRVEELCQKALDLSESRRAEFLQSACGNDDGLRKEVEASARTREEGSSNSSSHLRWRWQAKSLQTKHPEKAGRTSSEAQSHITG